MKDLKLKLEIKNLKITAGEETARFKLSLHINKKRSAIISSAGTGDRFEWQWLDKQAEKLFKQHLSNLIETRSFTYRCWYEDQLIEEMIEDIAIQRACKTRLCIKINGEEGYRILNEIDSPYARLWTSAWFADKEFEFLNDRYLASQTKKPTTNLIKANFLKNLTLEEKTDFLKNQREKLKAKGEIMLKNIDALLEEARQLN